MPTSCMLFSVCVGRGVLASKPFLTHGFSENLPGKDQG